jgi:hypothetical protein
MGCSAKQARLNAQKSTGPRTKRGKEIASRNATKHGLLAEQPPLLASEDLETFQGIMQGLIDKYQPEGVLEWHCVQQIAMCIQRQHRLWAAEAAVGNQATLPPVQPPATDDKCPDMKPNEASDFSSEYHPANIAKAKQLLSWFLDRTELPPTNTRTKYFTDEWDCWRDETLRGVKRILDEFPATAIAGMPDGLLARFDEKKFQNRWWFWIQDIKRIEHPYAVAFFYKISLSDTNAPKDSKHLAGLYVKWHQEAIAAFQAWLDKLTAIESEQQSEAERVEREQAERDRLTASPIPQSVGLLARYETHINNQLMQALERLNTLKGQRQANS